MTNTNNYPFPVQQKSGSSTNSFLFGLIVGVLLTLLFTTKKGRKLLRILTEEGWSKFTDVEDILRAMGEDEEYEASMEEADEEPLESEMPDKDEGDNDVKSSSRHSLHRLTSGRKFFRKPVRR